jgi:hypothetical protein
MQLFEDKKLIFVSMKEHYSIKALAACSQLHASSLRPLFLARALSALRLIEFLQSTKVEPGS